MDSDGKLSIKFNINDWHLISDHAFASSKAWKTIRKLSNDPTTCNPSCLVSGNQVAHQLLVNGRGTMPSKPKRLVLLPATERYYSMVYPFSEKEYRKGVAILKNNKASGKDDVLVEQLKNLAPKFHRWLLKKCFMENKIPTLWKQSNIIAIVKPVKSYRPRLQTTRPTSGGAVTAVTNCCANCVEPSRHPQWGPDFYRFVLANRPCGPAGWLALLFTKLGYVETNPGPTTLNNRVWICDICYKQIHVRKPIS